MTSLQPLVSLMDGLYTLKDVQKIVSGAVPGTFTGKPTPDQIRTVCMAISAEAHEIADGLGWKPWKPVDEPDLENVKEEFADLLAFTGLLLNYLHEYGITAGDLALAYKEKSFRNIRRFQGAADGRPRVVEETPESEMLKERLCNVLGLPYEAEE